jgi:sec-independent protein translocase protein TatC
MSDEIHEKMPLLEHLVELRRRLMIMLGTLLVFTFISYFFAGQIFEFLARPLAHAFGPNQGKLIYTHLTEAFMTEIKLALVTGAFFSFPVIANQLWLFMAPGLYKHERQAILPFLFATPILFFMGGALAYYFVFPMAWKFFLSFQLPGMGGLPIEAQPRVEDYLSLVITMIFAFGICFQLPVLMSLLARMGLITSAMLIKQWRYAVLAVFVASAILAPPDVISMIGLAIPLLLLYGVSVLLVRWIERPRKPAETSLIIP